MLCYIPHPQGEPAGNRREGKSGSLQDLRRPVLNPMEGKGCDKAWPFPHNPLARQRGRGK